MIHGNGNPWQQSNLGWRPWPLPHTLAPISTPTVGPQEEYMNVDNREYVFRVLNDVTKLPFLAEARFWCHAEDSTTQFLMKKTPF